MKIFGNLKNEAESFLEQYKAQSPAAYAAAQQAVGGLLILDGFIGIDNPFGRKQRRGIFGSFIGIFVGIIFLIVPTVFGNISGISKMTAMTTATVVSVSQPQTTTSGSGSNQSTSSTCTATAKYTVNGQEYTQAAADSSSSTCSYAPGQAIQISYNPDNPGQWSADAKTVTKFLKIFYLVGVVAIITSLFTFVIRLLSIIFGWKILKSGRALAKTLPAGTDLSSAIKEMEQGFKTSLFGFKPGVMGAAEAAIEHSVLQNQPPAATQQGAPPQSVQPQQSVSPQTPPANQNQNIVQPQNNTQKPL